MKSHLIIAAGALFALVALPPLYAQVVDGRFAVASNLRAGIAMVETTPTEVAGIKVVRHRREVTGVRDALSAGVLILDGGETMDTIGACEDMVKLARADLEKETGVPAANIMVSASHNHSVRGIRKTRAGRAS